ncbi:MAG: UDP-N-acetylmuramyl pentapeptide phosphotransferase [Acidobacteria bacterium]|nr:UDP-N-acetylmuramyl pentapeptide phosphotransferase [Acidobacteriota bacterium]
MNTFFALFLIALFASLAITPLVRRLCERFRLLDVPLDERRVHTKAIPRLGGVGIYLSVLIALSTLPLVDNLFTESLHAYRSQFFMILIPATLVLCLGMYDDLRGANATLKFAVLGMIAALFFWMGGRIDAFAIPFVGSVHLPSTLSFVVTILWLVGITNAFNLIDGMDGLASGAALFSSLVILVVSLAGENPLMIVVALVLCGALSGFLRYNFNPASIFLGDSGALFVGFTLAALSVVGTHKASTAVAVITPILAFGLPLVDTSVTLARRLISGRPVFQGDSEHIHHMLLARGWSQRHVAMVLYGVCAAFGLLAMIFTKTSSPLMGFVLFVVVVAVVFAVGRLRYHEMDEIRAGVKRTVGDRRVRVANNINVRRASLALSKAANLGQLFHAISQMLASGEFVYAEARLGQAGDAEDNERAFANAGGNHAMKRAELCNGRISWSWGRDGIESDEVVGSRRFWSVRLPLCTDRGDWGWINLYREVEAPPLLVDMSYLCDLFRRELSDATERVLAAPKARAGAPSLGMSVSAGKLSN